MMIYALVEKMVIGLDRQGPMQVDRPHPQGTKGGGVEDE